MLLHEFVWTFLLGNCVVSASCTNYQPLKYNIPKPSIEVFKPRGLKVSIPDTPGIQLFAFHGNINKPMTSLHAGQFSEDILHKEDGQWVFEDLSVRLRTGDKIYFWLFVIKNNLGYRYDNGVYEVEELVSRADISDDDDGYINRPLVTGSSNNDEKRPGTTSAQKNEGISRICENLVLNLTQSLLDFKTEVDSLRDINDVLRDIVERQSNSTQNLYLEGRIPRDEDPVSVVQRILRQKLMLSVKVEGATRIDKDKIKFEVTTIGDKISVIQAAKEKLKNAMFRITY